MFATIYSIPLGTTITQQWATNTNSTAQKIINFIQVGVLLINYNIVLSLAESCKTEKIFGLYFTRRNGKYRYFSLWTNLNFRSSLFSISNQKKSFFLSTFTKFTSYCSSHYNANPFCKGWFTSFIHIPFYTYSGLFSVFWKVTYIHKLRLYERRERFTESEVGLPFFLLHEKYFHRRELFIISCFHKHFYTFVPVSGIIQFLWNWTLEKIITRVNYLFVNLQVYEGYCFEWIVLQCFI